MDRPPDFVGYPKTCGTCDSNRTHYVSTSLHGSHSGRGHPLCIGNDAIHIVAGNQRSPHRVWVDRLAQPAERSKSDEDANEFFRSALIRFVSEVGEQPSPSAR